jgi:protein-tyrosine-phosphatase
MSETRQDMHILLVCTGNTCRTPMAEAILRTLVDQRGLTDVTIASAGTGAWEGAPASEGAYLVGLEHGLDLSRHRARPLSPALAGAADLILTMSRSHRQRALDVAPEERVHVLGEYAGFSGESAEVPDPFGGDIAEYRETYRRLEQMLGVVAERLARERTGGER